MNSINLDSRALNNFTSLSDGNLEQVDGGSLSLVAMGIIVGAIGTGFAAGVTAGCNYNIRKKRR